MEHEKIMGEYPGWRPSPSGRDLLLYLVLTFLEKMFYSARMFCLFPPTPFPQRISWLSIIILVSLTKHFLEMSTSNKHLYSCKHCRKSSRWVRGDAEETLRTIRVKLLSARKFWRVILEKHWMLCQAHQLLFSHLTSKIASGTVLCRIYR